MKCAGWGGGSKATYGRGDVEQVLLALGTWYLVLGTWYLAGTPGQPRPFRGWWRREGFLKTSRMDWEVSITGKTHKKWNDFFKNVIHSLMCSSRQYLLFEGHLSHLSSTHCQGWWFPTVGRIASLCQGGCPVCLSFWKGKSHHQRILARPDIIPPGRQLRRTSSWKGFMQALPMLKREIFLDSLKRHATGVAYLISWMSFIRPMTKRRFILLISE